MSVCDHHEYLEESMREIKHAVQGNGKEGLVTRVARMEENIDELRRRVDESIEWQRKMLLAVFGTSASSLVWLIVKTAIGAGS